MNTKHKGNIALSNAISYFAANGYYIFLPVADNGGAIDIAVSLDGINLQRVQCKYTTRVHHASKQRDPASEVWECDLRQVKTRPRHQAEIVYNADSFDFLFITTPGGNYLIEWKSFCEKQKQVPCNLRIGKKLAHYKIS